jgi:flagellar basal body-associated protein FliL
MARFRPDESDGDGQPPAKSRRGLIIGLAVAGVVLVALAAVAIVASMSGGKSGNYPVGSCVKQSGDKATSVSCSESGAYTVVSNVDSPSKCSDQGQPYVLLQQHGVADQVLCLKPAH